MLTSAPSPLPTTITSDGRPINGTGLVAPVTLEAGILDCSVIVNVPAVVGVPVIVTVTTVLLINTAGPAVSPGGRFDTAKSDGVIDVANVALDNVYLILALLTAWLTLRLFNPVNVTVMPGESVVIPALRCAVPAL